MNGALLAGLSPWLVFAVSSRSGGVSLGWAALLALVAALGIAVRSWRISTLRRFEVIAVIIFGGLTAAGLSFPGVWLSEISGYGRAVSALCLAGVALGSLAATPFTEEYTRDMVPGRLLGTAEFAAANRTQTTAWGVTALVVAASFLSARVVGGHFAATMLNWLVPLAVILACIRFTSSRWYDQIGDGLGDPRQLSAALVAGVDQVGAPGATAVRKGRPLRVVPPARG